MSLLPEIFAGVLSAGGVRADILKEDDQFPATFVDNWRSIARASARAKAGLVLARVDRGDLAGEWKLSGQEAIRKDGRRIPAGHLAGVARFSADESRLDAEDSLVQALWGDALACFSDDLREEADHPSGGISMGRFRAIFRLRGLRGRGLDELTGRFNWNDGISAAPADVVLRESINALHADDVAVFSDEPRRSIPVGDSGQPDLINPASVPADVYCRFCAAVEEDRLEQEIESVRRQMADLGFRGALRVVERILSAMDGIFPANYLSRHESQVRFACLEGAASPEAIASHPALVMEFGTGPNTMSGLSLRGLIRLDLGDAGLEVRIPLLAGGCFLATLASLDGTLEQAIDDALVLWAQALALEAHTPEQIEECLHPYTVPEDWPLLVARQGDTVWSVRPSVLDGQIFYRGCCLGASSGWEDVTSKWETYETALLDMVRTGVFSTAMIEDEQMRDWVSRLFAPVADWKF